MTFLEKRKLLQRMDDFIRRKATGTPEQFARKLEISESSLYRNLKQLQLLGGEIEYDIVGECYYYIKPCKLVIAYQIIDE